MNIHDELSDDQLLRAASDSLSGLPMANPPDVGAIVARGRARRRRQLTALASLSVTSVAAVTVLALALTGALGTARAGSTGTSQDAAFTLVSNSDGTATLTINPKELLDPVALQGDLKHEGIPAVVTVGSICSSDPAPAGFSQVVSSNPAGPGTWTPQSALQQPTLTIDPSALPTGTELSVANFRLGSGEQQADFVLVDMDSYTCSSVPPDPNGLPDGYGPSDGFGLLYGGPG